MFASMQHVLSSYAMERTDREAELAPRVMSNNAIFFLLVLIASMETFRTFSTNTSMRSMTNTISNDMAYDLKVEQRDLNAFVVTVTDDSKNSTSKPAITPVSTAADVIQRPLTVPASSSKEEDDNDIVKAVDAAPVVENKVAGEKVAGLTAAGPALVTKAAPPPPADIPTVKIPPKLKDAMDRNPSNRSIVFVHVGKCGGVTLETNVAAQCNGYHPIKDLPPACPTCPNRTKATQTVLLNKCYGKFTAKQKLANQTRAAVHMHHVPNNVIQQATTYLVSIRNPVERVISTYRYTHPGNCKRGIKQPNGRPHPGNYGCWMMDHGKIQPGLPAYQMFNACWPSPAMEEFSQAILDPWTPSTRFKTNHFNTSQIMECRQMARKLIQGDQIRPIVAPHMEFNYKYYAQLTYQKYPQKEVFALRTEHEWEDMIQLDVAMGGTGKFQSPDKHFSHGSEHYQKSPLSPVAYGKLCCVLEEELNQYFSIYDRALNLNGADRAQANKAIRKTCGIAEEQSWFEWRTACRDKLKRPLSVSKDII